MTQSFALVQSDCMNRPSWRSEDFSPRQLSEAYGTILALKSKLELAAQELVRLCEARTAQPTAQVESSTTSLVEAAILERGRRCSVLPARLFADPAWDILLELYHSELRQCRISVSNLCTGANVPATTALRWITTLEDEGLLARDPDRLDRRRFYVRLTARGSTAMTQYFWMQKEAERESQCTK